MQDVTKQFEPIARAALLAHEPAPAGTRKVDAATITLSMSANSDGDVQVSYSTPSSVGRWDYVALFEKAPANPPDNYLRRQWQYVEGNSSPLETSYDADGSTAYWAAYCSYDYGTSAYVVLAQIGPQTVGTASDD
jgi:hypothetical protein